jgi:hypothetical protein
VKPCFPTTFVAPKVAKGAKNARKWAEWNGYVILDLKQVVFF